GAKYVPAAPRRYTVKAKNAQEAHEAIRPTDLGRRPRDISRHLEADQAKLYELIWRRTIASQMESAEQELTSVDILAAAGKRRLDFRATGQVVRFDGFLALYQEGRDDEEDEESGRLPPMAAGEPLAKERIEAAQHFTEPPPRFTEATLVKRMEELGIGRPSTYASTLAVLRDRAYVRLEKKRLFPEDKGRLVTAFLEAFFTRYVGYGFTADLEEKLDEVSNSQIEWKDLLRDFWREFSAAIDGTRELRTTQVLDSLNELLGPHIFPAREDGADPRLCPLCHKGQLSLKLGKFGAFIGCSNYPECKFTRVLSPNGPDQAKAIEGDRPGVRALGQDPATGEEVSLRSGRFGDYVQQGEGDKPKRCSLPKAMAPADLTLEQALALLSLPREVARHPTSGEPILAGVGRYGAYVQHGKTYANLGKDEDVLAIGANRAIDLIVAKESGAGGRRFGAGSGRALGEHPTLGGAVTVKEGRFGAYVNHGKINATLPKGVDTTSLTLEEAVAALAAKASGDGGGGGRVLGEHPNGGPVSVRPGRFGAYVNWGKVNATIPKSVSPDEISLGEAVDLIEEKEGRPAGPRAGKTAKPTRKPPAKAGATKKAASSSAPPFEPDAKAKAGSTSAKSSTLKAQARPAGKPARAKRKA
ncbi:MAG: topoisomerase C-terminal repeat-containing protein, partial [Roseiarcus sp.]